MPEFKPKTVYVTYIAATPEKVWQALTSSEFTRQYFWDRDIELEPKLGGAFALKLPDGKVNVRGKVIAWTRRASCRSPGRSSGRKSSASCPNAW